VPTENSKISVLLVSLPGNLRNSLLSMLNSLPDIEIVGSASGGLSAYELLKVQDVKLVVIDANLPKDEVLALLHHIRMSKTEVRSVVLTMTTKKSAEFTSAGADVVLPRSSTARRFAMALELVEL